MILSLSVMVTAHDAQFVADLIKERFGYENFMIDYIGATILQYWSGTVALFLYGRSPLTSIAAISFTPYK